MNSAHHSYIFVFVLSYHARILCFFLQVREMDDEKFTAMFFYTKWITVCRRSQLSVYGKLVNAMNNVLLVTLDAGLSPVRFAVSFSQPVDVLNSTLSPYLASLTDVPAFIQKDTD